MAITSITGSLETIPEIEGLEKDDYIWFTIDDNRTIRLLGRPKFNNNNEPIGIEYPEDLLIQGDMNSRTFCFVMQRYYENQDLTSWNAELHFKLPGTNGQNDSARLPTSDGLIINSINDDDNFCYFSCQPTQGITIEAGKVSFSVSLFSSQGRLRTKPFTFNIPESIIVDDDDLVGDLEPSWVESVNTELGTLSTLKNQTLKNTDDQFLTDGSLYLHNKSNPNRVTELGIKKGDDWSFLRMNENGATEFVKGKSVDGSVTLNNQMIMTDKRTDFTQDVYVKNNKVATETYVNSLMTSAVKRAMPPSLENVTNPDDNTIYMVPATDTQEDNVYNEFMYINRNWELIGSTAIDLNDYQKKLVAGRGISLEEDNIEVKTGGGLGFDDNGKLMAKCDTRLNTIRIVGGNAELAVNTDVIATKEDLENLEARIKALEDKLGITTE